MSAMLVTGLTGLFVVSCKIKNNDSITPTYRSQSHGTGANPNINVAVIPVHQTNSYPATQNSSFQVAGNMSGWVFDGCASHPDMFTGRTGNTTVQIKFNGPITAGTYALTSGSPASGQAQMIITNAPGQPADINWYSKAGIVIVTPSGSGYSVTFSNIQCTQINYIFPVVTISGGMVC